MKTLIEIEHLYDSNIDINKKAFNNSIRKLLQDSLGKKFKVIVRSKDV